MPFSDHFTISALVVLMRKRTRITLLLVTLVAVGAAVTFAGVRAEKLDEGLYHVWYEPNPFTAGGAWTDNAKKNTKKLYSRVWKICKEEGYGFVWIYELKDIKEDPDLRDWWNLAVGGAAVEQDSVALAGEGGQTLVVGRTNVIHRLVRFSAESGHDFDACAKK